MARDVRSSWLLRGCLEGKAERRPQLSSPQLSLWGLRAKTVSGRQVDVGHQLPGSWPQGRHDGRSASGRQEATPRNLGVWGVQATTCPTWLRDLVGDWSRLARDFD